MSLILCACGCGGEKIPAKDGRIRGIYIYGHHLIGKHCSEETKLKISNANRGKKRSEEVRKIRSESMKGKYCGEDSPSYKGGSKLSNARQRNKRRRRGFIPLNSCDVDGWVGHHLDFNYVIFIPEELHKSVWHSVTKNRNMDIINDKVYDWFVRYYLR